MRVAYVCSDSGVPVFGRKGCSIHVQEVIRALLRAGVQVELFAARVGGSPPAGLETVALHELPSLSKGNPAEKEKAALRANLTLRIGLGHRGGFDLVYERYSLWSFAGMEFAREQGIPGLLEVNAPLIEEQAEHRVLIHRRAAEAIASRAFAAAAGLLAVSAETARYLKQRGVGSDKVHVVPNGINPQRFPVNRRVPGSRREFVVGFVGTLKPWHGLSGLIEAFARAYGDHPEMRLRIVGDGPQREALVADVAARGLAKAVDWIGAVPPDEVPGWLASMDAAVAPYPELREFYFSPLKVFEYMAAGLPVVASRIGQIKQIIQNGVNGLLVPPGDAGALASTLARLCSQPGLGDRLGRAARAAVIEKYTWDGVAQRVLEIAANRSDVRLPLVEAR